MLYGCVLEESGTMFWCGTFKLVPKLTEGVLNDLKKHIIKLALGIYICGICSMEPWLIHDEKRSTSDPDSAPGFGSGFRLRSHIKALESLLKGLRYINIYIYIYTRV